MKLNIAAKTYIYTKTAFWWCLTIKKQKSIICCCFLLSSRLASVSSFIHSALLTQCRTGIKLPSNRSICQIQQITDQDQPACSMMMPVNNNGGEMIRYKTTCKPKLLNYLLLKHIIYKITFDFIISDSSNIPVEAA